MRNVPKADELICVTTNELGVLNLYLYMASHCAVHRAQEVQLQCE